MPMFRILIIAADAGPMIAETIGERFTHVTIVAVTAPAELLQAIKNQSYDAICLQYPLSWNTTPSVTEMLAQWLPSCPILVFGPHEYIHPLEHLISDRNERKWVRTA